MGFCERCCGNAPWPATGAGWAAADGPDGFAASRSARVNRVMVPPLYLSYSPSLPSRNRTARRLVTPLSLLCRQKSCRSLTGRSACELSRTSSYPDAASVARAHSRSQEGPNFDRAWSRGISSRLITERTAAPVRPMAWPMAL